MMTQGTGAPDASLPRLLQTDTPTRTMTLSSRPTLRQALTMPGPGPLLATAAAGGSTAYSAAIGQVALKMGRMMSNVSEVPWSVVSMESAIAFMQDCSGNTIFHC